MKYKLLDNDKTTYVVDQETNQLKHVVVLSDDGALVYDYV